MGKRDKKSAKYNQCKLADGNPCIPCSKGINLDSLIAQARKALDNLLLQRQDIHTEINASHGRIIHRLPPEVSATIFLFSLSEEKTPSIFDNEIPSHSGSPLITTPLTIGAVCRDWRRVAWASPRLWTDISIPAKPRSDYKYLDTAHDWLERSGELPLSLRLYTPRSAVLEWDPELLDNLSHIIRLYLRRFYRLEISCPVDLLPAILGDAPLLEEIKVTSDHDEYDSDLINLHSTKTEGVRLSVTNYALDCLVLPYENVWEFEGMVTVDEFIIVFATLPNLRECRFFGLKDPDMALLEEAVDTNQTITHKRLEKLTLHSSSDPSSTLLNVMYIPSLSSLTVRDIDIPSIQKFVLRSGCTLRYLHLDSYNCKDTELYDLFCSTSTLEELHLVQNGFFGDDPSLFFKSLAQSPVIGSSTGTIDRKISFLPKLAVLTFTFGKSARFPWDLVARIFGTIPDIRNPRRRPLMDLQIMGHGSPSLWSSSLPALILSKDVTRKFLKIAKEGIRIKLYNAHTKDDILMHSMNHHKITVPAWYY